ncbi:VOC family protein [Nocardioides taihuensis]|uniref:VOC family protein n=1 Tax=Nocardioides taihuensis TaxID=1835606 RepID=A0ABW0BQF3_9ACTN
MGLVIGMDNHDIACLDIEAMYDFYVNTLGMVPAYPFDPREQWFAATAGSTTLYFFRGEGEHLPKAGPDIEHNRPGLESLAFLVADLDKAIAELDGRVEWCGDAETWRHPNGSWFYFRHFYDVEGNKLSLSEAHDIRWS